MESMNNNVRVEATEVDKLWEQYLDTKDMNIRNQIVDKYSYIVKIIAIRIRGIYQQYGEVDDIVNEGILALMDAIDRFDITKNIKFETYATIRVKGAIIDYVRKQAWTPRRVNKNRNLIDSAEKELCHTLGRTPTDKEIADYIQVDLREYTRMIGETTNTSILSFEDMISQMSYKNMQSKESLPEESCERDEVRRELAEGIKLLNDKEKLIISMYYKDELKLKEIAEILNISNSRASQIHSQALEKLNAFMKKLV